MGLERLVRGILKPLDVGAKIVLFPLWYSGRAPFLENGENSFIVTKTEWGSRGPCLRQGTRWHIPFLYNPVKDSEGKDASVPADSRDEDLEVRFRTLDNFAGVEKLQFIWRVPNEEGARRFYWRAGKDIGRAKEVVQRYVSEEIAKKQAEIMAKEEGTYLRSLVDNQLGRANDSNPVYKRFGIVIEEISGVDIAFDQTSQDALMLKEIGERESQKRIKLADAENYQKKLEQDREVYEAQREAEAETIRSSNRTQIALKYIEAARAYKEAGSTMPIGDLAMRLMEADNLAKVASNNNINAVYAGGGNSPMPFPVYRDRPEAPEQESNS